jgi:hypothetical protein
MMTTSAALGVISLTMLLEDETDTTKSKRNEKKKNQVPTLTIRKKNKPNHYLRCFPPPQT